MLKQCIKRKLTILFGSDIKQITDLNYQMAEVISFDLFDTLVFRNCSRPEDIFTIVEETFDREYGKKSCFFNKRVEAQKKACNSTKDEISFDDIYNSFEGIAQDDLDTLKELEKKAEYDFITPNNDMITLFRELVDSGKKVIITTDMYLPFVFIEKLLNKCNISGYDKIFLSCKEGKSKRKGELFQIISSSYNVNYSEIIHIGDNFMSDYYIPRKLGINCALYKRRVKNKLIRDYKSFKKDNKQIIDSNILDNISKNSCNYDDLNYVVGNRVLGPILAGYSSWLYDFVKKERISNIVFLSREGFIMKKAFDCLYSEDKDIVTNYINVSRLALLRCIACETNNFDELIGLFGCFIDEIKTVFDFHQILVGGRIRVKTEKVLFATSLIDTLSSIQKNQIFNQIAELYFEYFNTQNDLLKEYLNSYGFKQTYIALADIGWAGTMQKYLQKIFPNVKIVGNYLAVWNRRSTDYYSDIKRRGFLCDPDEWKTQGQLFRFTMPAIETLFMNKEGTTVGYRKNSGCVYPIKENDSWSDTSLRAILRVQDGAMDYLNAFMKLNLGYWFGKLDSKAFFRNYAIFTTRPNRFTTIFYDQFDFEHGISKEDLTSKHSLSYYLFHVKEAFSEFEKNRVKVIWLYSVIKIPFPFYSILLFLTNNMGMESNLHKKWADANK